MDDLEGKRLTLRPQAERLGDARWRARLTAWWDQGEVSAERTMPLDGEFPSEAAALKHAVNEAQPLLALTEVPADWLR